MAASSPLLFAKSVRERDRKGNDKSDKVGWLHWAADSALDETINHQSRSRDCAHHFAVT